MHSRSLSPTLRLLGTRPVFLPRIPIRNVATNAPQPSIQQRSPWLRRLAYIAIFGVLGKIAGDYTEKTILFPNVPGTVDDKVALQGIEAVYNTLPVVQKLRENPNYKESAVYENFSEDSKPHRLTSGPMAGSRGLGLQVGVKGRPSLTWLTSPLPPSNCQLWGWSS